MHPIVHKVPLSLGRWALSLLSGHGKSLAIDQMEIKMSSAWLSDKLALSIMWKHVWDFFSCKLWCLHRCWRGEGTPRGSRKLCIPSWCWTTKARAPKGHPVRWVNADEWTQRVVLVCLDCRSKIPQTGWWSRIKVPGCWVRALYLADKQPPANSSLHRGPRKLQGVPLSLSWRSHPLGLSYF